MKKLSFWYHLGVGIATIGIALTLAAYVFAQVEQSMFPWWVYPLFCVYVIVVLAIDFLIDRRQETVSSRATGTALAETAPGMKMARPEMAFSYQPHRQGQEGSEQAGRP